jgi:hypothetical protein
MKEIKYQVYHKPTKTIQAVAVIDFNNRVLDTYGIDEPIYDIPFEDVEWREYIGKTDIKSTKIHTRDIVRDHEPDPRLKGKKLIGVIGYEQTGFVINWKGEELGITDYFSDYLEVIGNIDQNPGLLNEN